jgi:hypothetical protein
MLAAAPGVHGSQWRRPGTLLAAVAVLHALSPLVILGVHWGFGIDETVYLSQLNAYVPAGLFSAPRARGTTLIAAPVTLLTSSVAAVRVWVAALAGLALYLSYRPWLRLRDGHIVPLAALLFSTLWMVIYYAFELMPNEWDALATLAACGYLLLYLRDGRRRHVWAVAALMACVALFRPSDAAYAGAALCVCCVFLRTPVRRRTAAAAAVALGAAAGAAEWVIEAYTSYGGLAARISAAQNENGGGGLHFAGLDQARTLAGPLLCRAGCHAHAAVIFQLWWVALAALLVVAVVTVRERTLVRVPLAVGLAAAAQYVFTVPYSAPRFLIPAYALLSIPCALGLMCILRAATGSARRRRVAAALAVGLVAHTALQVGVIAKAIAPGVRRGDQHAAAEARQLAYLGVRPPCLVLGEPTDNERLAYLMRCANVPRNGVAVRDEIEDGTHVVWLSSKRPPRVYGADWARDTLARSGRIYLSDEP